MICVLGYWLRNCYWVLVIVIGKEDVRRNTLLNVLQRSVTLSKTTKVVSHSEEVSKEDQSGGQNLQQALEAARLENCSVCGSDSLSLHDTITPGKLSGASDFDRSEDDDDDDDECHEAMEIVPVKGAEEDSGGSITMLVRKLPESRPGWPLLRRAVSSLGQSVTPHRPSSKQIPVVQWALKLPPRNAEQIGYDSSEDKLSSLNAIVPFGINSITKKSSCPDNSPRKLPEELEGLYEKFSSTCRFFKYKELVSVTSDFSSGLFFSPLWMTCL